MSIDTLAWLFATAPPAIDAITTIATSSVESSLQAMSWFPTWIKVLFPAWIKVL